MWFSQALQRRASNGLDQIVDRLQRPAGPHRNCLVIPHLVFLSLPLFAHAATAGDALCDKGAKVGVVPAVTACGTSSRTWRLALSAAQHSQYTVRELSTHSGGSVHSGAQYTVGLTT
jgi:hypothetical protein